MKTILVDAINGLIVRETALVDVEILILLNKYENRKVIVTNANAEEREKFDLTDLPYDLFTMEHSPYKSSPEYYREFLNEYNLKPEDAIYFEHSIDAVTSATSV